MQNTAPSFTKTEPSPVPSARLAKHMESWLMAGDISEHSPRTLSSRRERVGFFLWYLKAKEVEMIDLAEMRRFFHYLGHGHKEPGGRWGNPRMTNPLSAGRIKGYHSTLRTFFRWLVAEGDIEASPMERIPPPIDRPDQVQPFTDEQIKKLDAAARRPAKSKEERRASPKRDEAIFLVLFDTGIRESELCGLTVADVDLSAGHLRIRHGKGNKARTVPFSRDTKRAIHNYLSDRGSEPAEPLFISEGGKTAGDALTRWGVIQLVRRWGKSAGIEGARCSPHTFRHTFAINFLRAGGNVFTLQQILGHSNLTMTMRYVAIAQADITKQHAQFSPVAKLRGKNR